MSWIMVVVARVRLCSPRALVLVATCLHVANRELQQTQAGPQCRPYWCRALAPGCL